MKWKEWTAKQIAALRAKLAAAPDAEKAAITAQIAELESVQPDDPVPAQNHAPVQNPAPAQNPAQNPAPDDLDARIERAVATAIEKVVPKITEGLDNRDKATQRKADIATALDQAVQKGKIPHAKRDEWAKRLADNYDAVKPILDELPDNPAVNKGANGTATTGDKAIGGASDGKKYDNGFARSIPSNVMKYVEESIQN